MSFARRHGERFGIVARPVFAGAFAGQDQALSRLRVVRPRQKHGPLLAQRMDREAEGHAVAHARLGHVGDVEICEKLEVPCEAEVGANPGLRLILGQFADLKADRVAFDRDVPRRVQPAAGERGIQEVVDLIAVAGEHAVGVVEVGQRDADLPQVVGALRPRGCLTDALHRGQQQRDQDTDDREQFQECEATLR